MTTAFAPVVFEAPLVNPSPNGLFAATSWTDQADPLRWLASGVDVRVFNYGGEAAFGVWAPAWCAQEDDLGPDDIKDGERPEFPDTYVAMTAWAYDQCDLTADSQAEVRQRAAQTLRLQEQNAVEAAFATRLLADAGAAAPAADVVAAVSHLEGLLAATNTLGFIHASATLAAYAAQAQLIVRSGATLKTPLGHTWVFGGGYVAGLADTLVATSPTFGYRGEPKVVGAERLEWNRFIAVAERSLVVGYEAAIGAAEIT